MNPRVSVVMGVYNGADELPATVESIIAQKGVDFEFIVVDDGSTDATAEVLSRLARRDARMRVLTQENQGLTAALIRGCDAARAPLIARQDAGDRSRPQRLATQARMFAEEPQLVMAGAGVRYQFEDIELYESRMSGVELAAGLAANSPRKLAGPPHHGSVMMRTDAYRAAGGYRREFYFAQDLDLWLRLAERGQVGMAPSVLYEATVAANAISGMHRQEQDQLRALALQSRQARRAGKDEAPILARAAAIRTSGGAAPRRVAAGHYFIGACLRGRAPALALGQFREALRHNPWHWRARLQALRCASDQSPGKGLAK